MLDHDSTSRIDGSKTPLTLIDRINSEEWVGAGLQTKSRNDYARKVSVLIKQIQSIDRSSSPVTPARMAQHLAERIGRAEFAQSTARAMKAAVLFWLAENAQSILSQGSPGFSEYERAYTEVRNLATNTLPNRTAQTSSPKLKALPKDVLEALERYGETASGVVYVGPLLAFLKANMLLGLRPEEWFDAAAFSYLASPKTRTTACLGIRVRNSKATHGRANGTHREILLHSISANDLATILHFLELIEMHRMKQGRATQEELAKSFFGPLRHCMSNALARIGYRHSSGGRPTLYSSRHQAVANAKLSGLNDREIAALFGHVSTSTAKSHYGKKLSGWMKTTFRPSPESLNAVSGQTKQPHAANPNERTIRAAEDWIRGPSNQ